MKLLARLIRDLFAPQAVQTPSVQQIGAIDDPGQLNAILSALAVQGQSSAGGGLLASTNAATTLTISNFSNAFISHTAGAATTLTFDYAYNLCKYLPQPLAVGQTFGFSMITAALTTIATPTLSDTAVTLAGTTSMLASALRVYQGAVTQVNTTTGCTLTAGTTFTSIAQVGSTNAFTVTLGTNAVVPVVGTAFYLGTTAGTLPPGWYPVVKVTSATSFVIATPPGTVWTCTAANLISSATCPSTYSPLVTITGLFTVGANVAV